MVKHTNTINFVNKYFNFVMHYESVHGNIVLLLRVRIVLNAFRFLDAKMVTVNMLMNADVKKDGLEQIVINVNFLDMLIAIKTSIF